MQWFLGISCQHFPSYWCQNSFRTVTVSGQSPFSRKAELFVFKYFCRFLMENSNHESSLQNFASKLLYQNIFSLLSIPFNIAHWGKSPGTIYIVQHCTRTKYCFVQLCHESCNIKLDNWIKRDTPIFWSRSREISRYELERSSREYRFS